MADARIKGITVVINGETTQLSKALSKLREQTKGLSGQLKGVNKLLAVDPTSLSMIAQKQALLTSGIRSYQKKLDSAIKAEREAWSKRDQWSAKDRENYQALQREVESTRQKLNELTTEAANFGNAASATTIAAKAQYAALGDTLLDIGKKLMVVSASTTLIGGYSIYAAAKYESAFAGVRKTVDATEREFEELSDTIREMALTKPIDATDIAYAAELGGQLGIAVENLGKFAGVIADLDVATNLDLEDASMKLAQFANIAGISEKDFDRLGSVIVDLGNNSATTESKIMNMSLRIAGSGSNIGLSAQEILALATSLASVGIEAEMGGNAISTIMNRIDKDVALGTDTLKVWADTAGMSVEAFASAWDSPETVMDAFMAVVNGMATYRDEGGNLNTLLKDMEISYMRQVDTMQRLSRTGDIVVEMVGLANNAWDENIALTREANRRYETTENQLKLVKNNFKEVAIQLGEIMTPTLKEFSGDLVETLHTFQNLDESTKQNIVKFLAFATAAGPVTLALAGVAKGMSWLIGLYSSAITKYALLTRGTAMFTDAVNLSVMATERAATKAKILNTVLTLSGSLMAGAVLVGVGLMVKGFMDAAEKERDFTDATERLTDSIWNIGDSAREAKSEMDKFSTDRAKRSFLELRDSIDEVIESQAELARDMRETWGDINGDAHALQIYMDTIEKLTGKLDENGKKAELTKDEQAQLIAAVSGYNEIMGTSYSVIDAQNGILDTSTEKLMANADAWIANAKAQAAQEMLVELTKTQIQLEQNLADAQTAHRDALLEYSEMQKAGLTGEALEVYADKVEETYGAVSDASKLLDENVEAQERLIDIQYDAQQTLTATADALGKFMSETDIWSQTLADAGIDVGELAGKLESIGITTADLNAVTPEQLAILAESFGLTADEIAAAFEELGISLPDSAEEAVEGAAQAIEDGAPQVVTASTNVRDQAVSAFDMSDGFRGVIGKALRSAADAFSLDSAEGQEALKAADNAGFGLLDRFKKAAGSGNSSATAAQTAGFGTDGIDSSIASLSSVDGYGGAVRLITGASSGSSAPTSNVTQNYYSVGNVDYTGDAQVERAVFNLFNALERKGSM